MENTQYRAYCFKCKKVTNMVPKEGKDQLDDDVKETIKNRSVHFKKGRCETCGTNTSAIVKNK